jgi:SAM-dependent methyltransferase
MTELVAHKMIAELQSLIDSHLGDRQSPNVLEAGCGSSSRLKMRQDAHIVGIDLSQPQLDLNTILDEKILGDIQDYELPDSAFDMIVCWDVLEHLDRPQDALANFARSLAPCGIAVLAFPNPCSVKGFATKITPHWFHVLAYKHIFRHPWAGNPGRGPFRTVMRPMVRPDSLKRFAHGIGLTVEHFRLYEGGAQEKLRKRLMVVGPVWGAAKALVKLASFGRLNAEMTDCIIVLQRAGR